MKHAIPITVAAFALVTSGCATFQSNPVVSQADAEGVTYRIEGNQLDEAKAAADEHCSTFNRRAFQESISRGSGDSRIVRYLCR
jgi:PBP1b-binding outer membrane lipoprotein LpoB